MPDFDQAQSIAQPTMTRKIGLPLNTCLCLPLFVIILLVSSAYHDSPSNSPGLMICPTGHVSCQSNGFAGFSAQSNDSETDSVGSGTQVSLHKHLLQEILDLKGIAAFNKQKTRIIPSQLYFVIRKQSKLASATSTPINSRRSPLPATDVTPTSPQQHMASDLERELDWQQHMQGNWIATVLN